MNKQDVIISLLKEIDKNIDNVNDSGGANINLKELTVTANGEYLPANYNADGFSKVTARFDAGTPIVKVESLKVTNDCIDENGYWAAELVDTSNITDAIELFYRCSNLRQLNVSGWDTSNITSMIRMFDNCSQLQQLDVSGWNINNVNNMIRMFANCSQLQQLDVRNWDTSNVTSMLETFINCSKLQQLDTQNWDTSKLNGMYYTFYGCKSLQQLDTQNWDTSNWNDLTFTFGNCTQLNSIIGNRTIDDVLANNISALNGLKRYLYFKDTILDRASLRAVINGLADLTGQTSQTLNLGETLIAKLTEEDIAIATAKNWTIA